jgi:hypothetical protein
MGGGDVPDNARARITSHLERYYSKLDMESPFKALDMGDVVKSYVMARLAAATDAKEHEQALREVGFSATEAKATTAKIGPQREVGAGNVATALKDANNLLSQLHRGQENDRPD